MSENKNSAARIRANNRYNDKAYDRINIAIPKGAKLLVQDAAEREGESVNQYVSKALLQRMGRDNWRVDGDTDEQTNK